MAEAICRVLLVDNDEGNVSLIREMLSNSLHGQVVLDWAPSFLAGQAAMKEKIFDAVLVGAVLDSHSGAEWIRDVAAGGYTAPMLLLTGPGSCEAIIAAMEAGAAAALPLAELTPPLLERSIRFAMQRKWIPQALTDSQEYLLSLDNPAATHVDGTQTTGVAQKNGKRSVLQQAAGDADCAVNHAAVKSVEDLLEIARLETAREKNRFKAVMEALPVGVAIVDMQGGLVEANREYIQIWGGNPPETSSVDDYGAYKAWWRETGEQVRPEEWASARAVQRGETVIGQMMQIQKFTGERNFVLNSAAPIFDAGGQSTGCAVVIMDVSRQVEIEEALRESEYRLHIGLENSPVTVFSQDRDLRYTWIYNPVVGISTEDSLGKRDDEIAAFDDVAELMAVKKTVIETGQGLRKEITLSVNGNDQVFHLTLEPLLDHRQQVVGLRGSAIDVTEQRKLMIRQLEYITQMEVHHRLLEFRERERQIIARELHDGPIQDLAGLIFHTQAIKEEIKDTALLAEVNEIRSMLQHIMSHLREVTNDLRPPSLIRFGVQKAIQNYTNEFLEKYPQIEVVLHLHPADDDVELPEQVNLALFRIYQEAISNIVRHANTTKIWVQVEQRDNCIVLEVRDNGKGFLVHDEVITEYMQNERYGLAGMKERADAIGGVFRIISEPEKGTRVVVTVPLSGNR